MNKEELAIILEKHSKFLNNEPDGERANLSGADLSRTNLSGANLSGANLYGAVGTFALGYFGKHHAIAAGGYISIGCERHTYDEWLESYKKIGEEYGYTPDTIDRYGAWIKMVVKWLKEEEAKIVS